MKIGNQKFEKVGEMKSDETGLRTSPKSFDLYQDTKNGALMGELPENHPVKRQARENKERQERFESFDLTQLTPLKAYSLLTEFEFKDKGGWSLQNKDIEIYGKINNGDEKELVVFKWDGSSGFTPPSNQFFVFYKDDTEGVKKGMNEASGNLLSGFYLGRNHFAPTLERYSNVEITSKNIKITSKNGLLIGGKKGSSAELSFLEVPEAYNELMKEKEKKEGKAE